MPPRSLLCTGALLAALAATAVAAPQPPLPPPPVPVVRVDPPPGVSVDALIEILREAMSLRDSAGRLSLLRGLRRLRDPALRPLFSQLASLPEQSLRAQGILGLADLEPNRGVDLLLLRAIEDPATRSGAIDEAVAVGLLTPEQVDDVARWTDIDPHVAINVAAAALAAGRPLPVRRLREWAAGDDPEIAFAASLLLAQTGDTDAQEFLTSHAAGFVADPARRRALAWVLGLIGGNGLTRGRGVALETRTQLVDDPPLRFVALLALLRVSPRDERVVQACLHELDPAADLGTRIRMAMAVLDMAPLLRDKLAPPVVDRLRNDAEPLVAAIGHAVESVRAADGPVEPITTLVATGYAPAGRWALGLAKGRSPADAAAIDTAVLRAGAAAKTADMADLAVNAAAEIPADHLDALARVLDDALATNDGALARAVLEGAIRSRAPGVEALARRAPALPGGSNAAELNDRRWPDAVCAGLATLLEASRAAPAPASHADPAQRTLLTARLSRIAEGEGRLPATCRVQAAWLALKALNEDRLALARLLTEAGK